MEKSCMAYILSIFATLCFAGYTIITKVALDKGMNRYVLVFYGNLFGTLASAPLALVFERRSNAKISVVVARDIFMFGLLGDVLGRTLYFAGLEYTSPTMAAAMSNLVPSLALVIAVICRMETLEISKRSSKAKIMGTVVAFSGATLMCVYKGVTLISLDSSHHKSTTSSKASMDKSWIKGSIMIVVSCASFAGFFILQGRTIKLYPAPIRLTVLSCLSGTVLSAIVAALFLDHKASSWSLSWDITLLGPLYNGIVFVALAGYAQIVSIRMRGAVFMTAFRPVGTIMVPIMGLFIVGEALHLGSVVGAILIILGLYAILWGKENELKEHGLLENTQGEESVVIKQEK